MNRCTVCTSTSVEVFVEINQVPAHCNLLWPTREGAISAPRGDLRLGFCRECGHIFNVAFDPAAMEYSQAYENSLQYSPRFQAYAEELAARLIDRYSLRDKVAIDIGCGKGDFLALLCHLGKNRGIGFDPSYVPEQMHSRGSERMTIVRDFYSPRYESYKADLIVCRHVLEHIQFPVEFVKNVRRSIGRQSGTAVYFEVPNVLYTLRDMGIWDLIYEHCSYFSASSLARLFTLCGFENRDQLELYDGQFLGIETFPAAADGPSGVPIGHGHEIAPLVRSFVENYRAKVNSWEERFRDARSRHLRVAVWGGGSKGVSFLNTLASRDVVQHMIDINQRKQGMFVAGTGQPVVAPTALRSIKPDLVVVMNPVYLSEIREQLVTLGISPTLAVA